MVFPIIYDRIRLNHPALLKSYSLLTPCKLCNLLKKRRGTIFEWSTASYNQLTPNMSNHNHHDNDEDEDHETNFYEKTYYNKFHPKNSLISQIHAKSEVKVHKHRSLTSKEIIKYRIYGIMPLIITILILIFCKIGLNKIRREDAVERQELANERELRLLRMRQKQRTKREQNVSGDVDLVKKKGNRKESIVEIERENAKINAIIAEKYRKPKRLQGGLPRDVNFQYSVIRGYNPPVTR